MEIYNENKAYEILLCSHARTFIHRLRQLPPDKWDWTPDQAAPTPRILASHALQWLICDRQHINEPDAAKHPDIPEMPQDPAAFCDAFELETQEWQTLLQNLTPEQMDQRRRQFNFPDSKMTVRGFVAHVIQNLIYKNGQFSELYFALGLDGTEPYEAPFPNPFYAEHCR